MRSLSFKFFLIMTLALLAAMAVAQPVTFAGEAPALTQMANVPGTANPNCAGPSMIRNEPMMFQGRNEKMLIIQAWCEMPNGEWAGWTRIRPATVGGLDAPIVWMSDTAPRKVPLETWTVWPSTLSDKSRSAYNVRHDGMMTSLSTPNGQRAQAGAICACDMQSVKSGIYTYCPYSPALKLDNVAVCRKVETSAALANSPKQSSKTLDTQMMLDMKRHPMQ